MTFVASYPMQTTFEIPGGFGPALLLSKSGIKRPELPSECPLALDEFAVPGRQGKLHRDQELCENMIAQIKSLREPILSLC